MPHQNGITDRELADIRKGEYITGLVIRSGLWVDGIQILTSLGNRSPFFGNKHGGEA